MNPHNTTCDVCNTPTPLDELVELAESFHPDTACTSCTETFLTTGTWNPTVITTAHDDTGTLHRIEDTAPEEPFIFTTCSTELTSTPNRVPTLNDIPDTETRCTHCNWNSTSMFGTQ